MLIHQVDYTILKIEINMLKIEICLTITNKKKSDEKYNLPTFFWLKNCIYKNELLVL